MVTEPNIQHEAELKISSKLGQNEIFSSEIGETTYFLALDMEFRPPFALEG